MKREAASNCCEGRQPQQWHTRGICLLSYLPCVVFRLRKGCTPLHDSPTTPDQVLYVRLYHNRRHRGLQCWLPLQDTSATQEGRAATSQCVGRYRSRKQLQTGKLRCVPTTYAMRGSLHMPCQGLSESGSCGIPSGLLPIQTILMPSSHKLAQQFCG